AGADAAAAKKGERPAIFERDGTAISTPVYDGAILGAGARVAGPAIIEEETTTIVIAPGWTAELHPGGSYRIVRERA
ncbi:hypothetical protein MMA22_23840, partial [Salmonella enterica]|nr:hypothetical protein [Salmonella enterica]